MSIQPYFRSHVMRHKALCAALKQRRILIHALHVVLQRTTGVPAAGEVLRVLPSDPTMWTPEDQQSFEVDVFNKSIVKSPGGSEMRVSATHWEKLKTVIKGLGRGWGSTAAKGN